MTEAELIRAREYLCKEAVRRRQPTATSRRARRRVRAAIQQGAMERPDRCERCGAVPDGDRPSDVVHAHHETYERPYDVEWLCRSCHNDAHSNDFASVKLRRRVRRGLIEYRRWRKAVDYPTCGDAGGWSATLRRPCKMEVAEPGNRCHNHPREKEGAIILRGGPADPMVPEPAVVTPQAAGGEVSKEAWVAEHAATMEGMVRAGP